MAHGQRTGIPVLLAILSVAGSAKAKPQVYLDFPSAYLPASPTQHPRILVGNRLPALQSVYAENSDAVKAFQHDIDSLLGYTSAAQD